MLQLGRMPVHRNISVERAVNLPVYRMLMLFSRDIRFRPEADIRPTPDKHP